MTIVVIRDVVPSRERDYDGWAHRVVSAAGRYGATGHTIITPGAAAPARRMIVQHFSEVR